MRVGVLKRPRCTKARRIKMQPTIVNYLAERSGHDYSIDETFNFNLPPPV